MNKYELITQKIITKNLRKIKKLIKRISETEMNTVPHGRLFRLVAKISKFHSRLQYLEVVFQNRLIKSLKTCYLKKMAMIKT